MKALALGVALLLFGPAHETPVVKRVQKGAVLVELSYLQDGERYTEPRVRIVRSGRELVNAPLKRVACGDCPTWRPASNPDIRNLDADRELEVRLDLFTGGAHCCLYTLIWDYRTGRYPKTLAWWGNAGYRIARLDFRGGPELVSTDDRFAAAFVAYAASASPIRIVELDRGRVRNVTRRFPGAVAADARQQWSLYRDVLRTQHREVRGVLAAWLADQYLLGRSKAGWRVVEAAYERDELGRAATKDGYPAGRAYLRTLRAFLRAKGYGR